jgi:hypothetical protein
LGFNGEDVSEDDNVILFVPHTGWSDTGGFDASGRPCGLPTRVRSLHEDTPNEFGMHYLASVVEMQFASMSEV